MACCQRQNIYCWGGLLLIFKSLFFSQFASSGLTHSAVSNEDSYWKTSLFSNVVFTTAQPEKLFVILNGSSLRRNGYVIHADPHLEVQGGKLHIAGTSCIVDEGHPHTSGSLGHFARRMLPWFSIEVFDGAPQCDAFFFTRTPKQPLSAWFNFVQQLVTGDRVLLYPSDLGTLTILDAMKLNYKSGWFRNPAEAQLFQRMAWGRLGLSMPATGTCYFIRRNGRNPENLEEVLTLLKSFGPVTILSFDNNTSVKEQASGFFRCSVLLSPHGSHNANVMFMQPGSTFIELNPHKFYHGVYNKLAKLVGVAVFPTRRNIAVHTSRLATWAQLDDLQCQGVALCRIRARNGKYMVNITDIGNALKKVYKQW